MGHLLESQPFVCERCGATVELVPWRSFVTHAAPWICCLTLGYLLVPRRQLLLRLGATVGVYLVVTVLVFPLNRLRMSTTNAGRRGANTAS